ncbi:MAG: dehydrogenase, partial [Saprospiraceae bacterium]|nr:dehydrogenase [Saprospiraceae bacterium]
MSLGCDLHHVPISFQEIIMIRSICQLALICAIFSCQTTDEKSYNIDFGSLTEDEKRDVKHAPASFELHDDVGLQVFASEPMMINPTNIDIDARGRVWVCEAQNYRGFRNDHPQREAGDRILILEDSDGDGKADTEKVFYQGTDINSALGIAKLGDMVYVAASPSMLVFTDSDGDDVPDQKDTLFTGLAGVDHDHGVHAVVFGPEGKLYFNFGNAGERLRLKSGELAKTRQGDPIEMGKTFRQGMIFRCNPDGTDIEILGHNFRNNYEVAVDPYGALWQSDNDDDGNRGTRINFVMEFGNYGFKDQVTGAGWRTPRIG